MRGIVSHVSQTIGILRLVRRLCGYLCYFVATMHLLSQSLIIVLWCVALLLYVTFCFSSARCIRWPGFDLIKVSSFCVVDVMLLDCVCCTKLIRTLITLFSELLLLREFDILELRQNLIYWSLNYQGVECPNFQGVSCRPRFV